MQNDAIDALSIRHQLIELPAERRLGRFALLRLDVGRPDYLGPLLDIVDDKLSKLSGRLGGHCYATEISKAGSDSGVRDGEIDFPVEPINHRGRGIFWRTNTKPCACLVAGYKVTHCRNLWQYFQPFDRGHRQWAQRARPNVRK
jgi:hypothetical protein